MTLELEDIHPLHTEVLNSHVSLELHRGGRYGGSADPLGLRDLPGERRLRALAPADLLLDRVTRRRLDTACGLYLGDQHLGPDPRRTDERDHLGLT